MIERLYKIEGTKEIKASYEILGAKIYSFIKYVEREWK
tara:strand:- start:661 stop:774 length:114 start_codon:yes stop_codon:yes gene_type:complete